MDRIDLFRIFARVVECASFTRAADMLGVPRSSVSTAVQELEARVGAKLLYRTTRSVAPTQDGSMFYERCLRLIADVEDVEGLFRQSEASPSGKLRIDVPARVGRLIIAPALPKFLARYPQIDIHLGITDRAVNLIEEGTDCALRVGALSDSSLIARPISELPLINVASAAYLRQWGVPAVPSDLKTHWAISYASPSTGRVEDWEWIEDGMTRTMHLRSRVSVNSAETYIACCLAGLGLIQIPAYDVQNHLASGELVEVLPGYRAGAMPMTLLYHHRMHLSRRLEVFAEWLTKTLKKQIEV